MPNQKLAYFMQGRSNNLDFIRFLAAVLVIYSHSIPLVEGDNTNEWLLSITGSSTFGGVSVAIFFVISGFLITMSYQRSSSLLKYFKSRILRIFPALIFCIIFTAFILGPILTSLPLNEYLTNQGVYKYMTGIILLPNLHPNLPGVFENTSYGSFVNGSLWTLKFEFLFYIGVAFLGILKILNKKVILFLFLFSLVLSIPNITPHLNNLLELGTFFLSGMLVYLYRNEIYLKKRWAIVSLIAIIVTLPSGLFNQSLSIFGTYLIFFLAYQKKNIFFNFTKYGDLSYGIYIYAFPVQQSIVDLLMGSNLSPFINFIISLTITIPLSFLSWHLVEKQAMKLKNVSLFKNRPSITS